MGLGGLKWVIPSYHVDNEITCWLVHAEEQVLTSLLNLMACVSYQHEKQQCILFIDDNTRRAWYFQEGMVTCRLNLISIFKELHNRGS